MDLYLRLSFHELFYIEKSFTLLGFVLLLNFFMFSQTLPHQVFLLKETPLLLFFCLIWRFSYSPNSLTLLSQPPISTFLNGNYSTLLQSSHPKLSPRHTHWTLQQHFSLTLFPKWCCFHCKVFASSNEQSLTLFLGIS